jgi:predicted DNA-binding antitoxin AbrB/MazE fold protein
MLSNLIRAIYQDGMLRPLEPLELEDGETVDISVISRQTP